MIISVSTLTQLDTLGY